ncbi:MAG: Tail Collar domain protein [Massilia sp.]|nr:Tail Collar domain protein [Massilia sp.]
MSDQFLGEIRMFGGTFPPLQWALCNGQLLPISQNTALFSVLGTTYGGDGRVTFALPNLLRRVPLHPGQGPGLTLRQWGELEGEEQVTLNQVEMPMHTHALQAAAGAAVSRAANAHMFATVNTPTPPFHPASAALGTMAPGTLAPAGGNQPHNNLQPYLTLTFIIALQGIYPSRN